MPVKRGPRCAVYTRKSSEEGLEQNFNFLDAQREACEAYIASQKHEGWVLIETPYDDGGLSGATLDRPALQRLLADIEAGKVEVVVVYKVDRLTRSLADFAKIVEVFDAKGVSFVSITQQFNTTSSMGRLTLNMLPSFAQFEREVTGERIRDKIAASKKKGMWMGGFVPLGYDARDRSLVVNEAEAETVRTIYRLYIELGCVRRVQEATERLEFRTKVRSRADGSQGGGLPLGRGAHLSYPPKSDLHRSHRPQGRELRRPAPSHHRSDHVGEGAGNSAAQRSGARQRIPCRRAEPPQRAPL